MIVPFSCATSYAAGVNRQAIPAPVRKMLRGAYNYQQRLRIWSQISRQIKGVSERDRRTIRHAIRRAPLSSLKCLQDWRDPVLSADATVEIAGIGRFNVKGGTDQLYIVLPARESELIEIMRDQLRPGDTFVDAGANIGFFSVLGARLVGAAGKVIAIEMMPAVAATLQEHARVNGCPQIEIVQAALSDESGRIINAWEMAGCPGSTSIVTRTGGHPIAVETKTLDDILPLGRIAMMKMDIERAELAALRGAGSSIQRISTIVFEQLAGEEQTSAFLRSQGFTVQHLRGSNYLATNLGR